MKKSSLILSLAALNTAEAFVGIRANIYQTAAASPFVLAASPFNQDILPPLSSSSEYPRMSKSSLHFQVGISEALLEPTELALPKAFELPKNAQVLRKVAASEDLLMKVEVNVGRIAMVAASVFLCVEVTTGKSLPEQIATSLGLLS